MQRNVREMYDVLYHDSLPSCNSCGFKSKGRGRSNVFSIAVHEPEVIEKGKTDFEDLHDTDKVRNEVSEMIVLFSVHILMFTSVIFFLLNIS